MSEGWDHVLTLPTGSIEFSLETGWMTIEADGKRTAVCLDEAASDRLASILKAHATLCEIARKQAKAAKS